MVALEHVIVNYYKRDLRLSPRVYSESHSLSYAICGEINNSLSDDHERKLERYEQFFRTKLSYSEPYSVRGYFRSTVEPKIA